MPQLTDAEIQQLQQRVAELELTLDNLSKSQAPAAEAPAQVVPSNTQDTTVIENIKSAVQSCISELRAAVLSGPNPTSIARVEKVIISLSGILN